MSDFEFSSGFWNWWVIGLTVLNILYCWWLIGFTKRAPAGQSQEGEVTGHKWDDDLEEYNNPLPSWWVWMFYITLIFSMVYLALYPGLGTFKGFLGWTEEGQYDREMAAASEKFDPIFQQYSARDLVAVAADPDALKIGQRLFLNYCSTCHGSDAQGSPGFPDLADNAWLYGGEPETIKTSILDGRNGAMPPWGAVLQDKGVDEVTAYVTSLSGRQADEALVTAGKAHYDTYCAACHMPDGSGNPALGAPNLSDNIWLYGGSPGVIKQSIAEGRNGKMPPHREFLGEDKVHLIAAYVYSLSAPQQQ